MRLSYILICLFPFSMLSQSIKGLVYDYESTVKGIKVFNISKKTKTYTDNEGHFIINATINDTLLFESLFHHSKSVTLKATDFNDTVVFELKKRINELGEVLLIDETERNKFSENEHSKVLNNIISEDKKNNPHLYGSSSKYGLDFVRLASMIGKLFKKKNKSKTQPIQLITYKILDSLFKRDKFFNLKLLNQDLNISEAHAHLFLDYLENKELNKTLISKENKVILLDSMFKFSDEFLKIIKDFEKLKD